MQTDKSKIYQSGYNMGYSIALHQDMPEIGYDYITNWGVLRAETSEDIQEIFISWCYEAEENNRQYTPFEYTAYEINNMVETKPYDPWEIYDNATYKGFIDNFNKRIKK